MTRQTKPGQRVIVALREMIAAGELRPGQRIAEIPTAEALGVSRMPVRTALRALEQEGLVVRFGARGYAARDLSNYCLEGALQVRGALEGLAARLAAERGLGEEADAVLRRCLARGDALFADASLGGDVLEAYFDLNRDFHDTIVAASGNPAIAMALAANNILPFASATALAVDMDDRGAAFERLSGPHRQHHLVYAAIVRGDAEAAERLMRDHAQAAARDNVISEHVHYGCGVRTAATSI